MSFRAALLCLSLAISVSSSAISHVSRDAVVRQTEPPFLSGTNVGDATYYQAGLGACGITSTDADYTVAISYEAFNNYPGYNGENPTTNPVCGKQIFAAYEGNAVTVTVTDACTGCALTDLDLTPAAFQVLASLSLGRLDGVTWNWV